MVEFSTWADFELELSVTLLWVEGLEMRILPGIIPDTPGRRSKHVDLRRSGGVGQQLWPIQVRMWSDAGPDVTSSQIPQQQQNWWFQSLVGGLVAMFWIFPLILGIIIIPSDELIFFRGVAKNHQPVKLQLYGGFPESSGYPQIIHVQMGCSLNLSTIHHLRNKQKCRRGETTWKSLAAINLPGMGYTTQKIADDLGMVDRCL